MCSDRYRLKTGEAIREILDNRQALRITECKKTYWGVRTYADCRLIRKGSNRVILFHAMEERWVVDDMIVEPPMFTVAIYWGDRPYNLYCWFDSEGAYVAAYFNVVGLPGYRLVDDTLIYHDLVLDVLERPNREPVILDLEELSSVDQDTSAQAKRVSEALHVSASRIVDACISALPAWLKR